MTETNIVTLAVELADGFRPARLVAPLRQQLDNSDFLYWDLVEYNTDENDVTDATLEKLKALKQWVGARLKREVASIPYLYLAYQYGGGLMLYVEFDYTKEGESEPVYDSEHFHGDVVFDIAAVLLSDKSEPDITLEFEKFKREFFVQMESKPEDWEV